MRACAWWDKVDADDSLGEQHTCSAQRRDGFRIRKSCRWIQAREARPIPIGRWPTGARPRAWLEGIIRTAECRQTAANLRGKPTTTAREKRVVAIKPEKAVKAKRDERSPMRLPVIPACSETSGGRRIRPAPPDCRRAAPARDTVKDQTESRTDGQPGRCWPEVTARPGYKEAAVAEVRGGSRHVAEIGFEGNVRRESSEVAAQGRQTARRCRDDDVPAVGEPLVVSGGAGNEMLPEMSIHCRRHTEGAGPRPSGDTNHQNWTRDMTRHRLQHR